MFSPNLLQDEKLYDLGVMSVIVNLLPPLTLSNISVSFLIIHSQFL